MEIEGRSVENFTLTPSVHHANDYKWMILMNESFAIPKAFSWGTYILSEKVRK